MTPTISHSPIFMLTSRFAWTPPNRIESPCASSTDIGDLHLLRTVVVEVELLAEHPPLDRADLLPDPAGRLRERQQEQQRPDHERRQLWRELAREVPAHPVPPVGDQVEHRAHAPHVAEQD